MAKTKKSAQKGYSLLGWYPKRDFKSLREDMPDVIIKTGKQVRDGEVPFYIKRRKG